MLITEIKPKEEILAKLNKDEKTFVIQCYGCKEVYYPADEIDGFVKEHNFQSILIDYLCNREYVRKYSDKFSLEITNTKNILIFSCGTGVQSFTEVLVETGKFAGKTVHAGCNTLYVNGFQGLTPACHNCAQCGTCYLNYTAGICPVTACSKGLLNGQCGGCKNGKCEVDKEMDCGWEKIFNKLNKTGKLDNKVHLRNFKIVP